MRPRFWEDIPLHQLTPDEWEALCDGCGRCCLLKLEDEETGELFFTNVACRLLDTERGGCRDYADRVRQVPGCLVIRADDPEILDQLPDTCAYRLRAEGRPLPAWHPLVSGDADTVKAAGIAVLGRVIDETWVHPEQLPEQIIDWVRPAPRRKKPA